METDRAQPTPEMIAHLAENLEVPLRERNRLLLAAGYAPHYRECALEDGSLTVVMEGLRSLLGAHLPYPALLRDIHCRTYLRAASRSDAAVVELLELAADTIATPEVLRYEAALRGNAAYLVALDQEMHRG